ncbi:hypothetical protein A1Q_4455 [Vibrio campbellii HY01]|nr:hypothetical protein A1Q_4455 [Vibrio campbellii HY01]
MSETCAMWWMNASGIKHAENIHNKLKPRQM